MKELLWREMNELKRKIFMLFILKLFVTMDASRKGSTFFPSPIKQKLINKLCKLR